jgi:hypothetical protein
MVLEDCFAKYDFLVTVLKGRKRRWCGEVTGGDVLVKGPETVLKTIGIALGMTARIADVIARRSREQARIARQKLIGLAALADPQLVALGGSVFRCCAIIIISLPPVNWQETVGCSQD